uniref:Uncharacterized protein LOC8276833 isoform X4 n=1 Tax=Rhizophora mucronata TaxID=61149 RepID=A0A2P2IVS8_RHIMU
MDVILVLIRWSHIWISPAYTIICNISNEVERCPEKLKAWQLSAKKYWGCLFQRNFNVVIGHIVLLRKSKKYMQLLMRSACSKYLVYSRQMLSKKEILAT